MPAEPDAVVAAARELVAVMDAQEAHMRRSVELYASGDWGKHYGELARMRWAATDRLREALKALDTASSQKLSSSL